MIADALDQTALSYRLDRTLGQPYSIYLAVEKSGIIEQLESWFSDFGFPMLALGGYCSQSHVDEVVRHVRDRDRPAVLIYAGDFDSSGEDIYRDFVERTGCWHAVRLIGLNEALIDLYGLPINPGKEADTRKAAFIARHRQFIKRYNQRMGTKLESVQIELDALEPGTLRELYQAEIARWWNKEAYAAILAREERERRILQKQVAKVRRSIR